MNQELLDQMRENERYMHTLQQNSEQVSVLLERALKIAEQVKAGEKPPAVLLSAVSHMKAAMALIDTTETN